MLGAAAAVLESPVTPGPSAEAFAFGFVTVAEEVFVDVAACVMVLDLLSVAVIETAPVELATIQIVSTTPSIQPKHKEITYSTKSSSA